MLHIQTLIQRLVDALPLNSQRALQFVESDVLLGQFVTNLTELALSNSADLQEVLNELLLALDRLHRPAQLDAIVIEQLLDSQLFLLRAIATIAENAAGISLILDENLVQRALSCSMAIYLQTNLLERWVLAADLNPVVSLTRLQKTPLARSSTSTSLSRSSTGSAELRDFSVELKEQDLCIRTLLSFVSSSNWDATYARIETMLRDPYVEDFEEEFNHKLRFIAHIKLRASAINDVLSMVSRCIIPLQKSTQLVLIEYLTTALTEWLRQSPHEIMTVCQGTRTFRTPKGLELFDYLLNFAENSKKKTVIWPFLAILIGLFPTEEANKESKSYKKQSYLQALSKMNDSKLASVVLQSYAFILYAATYLDRSLQISFAPTLLEIRSALSTREAQLAECVESEIFEGADTLFMSMHRLNLEGYDAFANKILVSWLTRPDQLTALQSCAVRCLGPVLQELSSQSKKQVINRLLEDVCPSVRTVLLKAVAESSRTSGASPTSSSSALVETILKLFCDTPEVLGAIDRVEASTDVLAAIFRFVQIGNITLESPLGRFFIHLQKSIWLKVYSVESQEDEYMAARCLRWVNISAESIRKLLLKLSSHAMDTQQLRSLLKLLQSCITERTQTLKLFSRFLGSKADVSTHEALIDSLEVSFLSLTSHMDYIVATKAARASYLILAEVETYGPLTQRVCDTLQNTILYEALGQTTFLTVGRNAVQKKIRACLRSGKWTLNLRRVWMQIHDRWELLTDRMLKGPVSAQDSEEYMQLEWRNLTGFLAALARMDESDDNLPVLRFLERFQEIFIHNGQESALIGEASAEILGNELHHSLFLPMLSRVQNLIETMRDKKGVQIVRSRHTLLADHLILLCRGLFERCDTFLDIRDGLDVGNILLELAKYLQICGQSHLRCRLRYCQFISHCAPRLDLICVAKILPLSRTLSNYLANWVTPVIGQNREVDKVSRDINTACLKALASLTRDMRFVSAANSSITQVFGDVKDFVHFVLPLLQMTDEQSATFSSGSPIPLLKEMLSNLLAVNQRSSFTTYISLSYADDPKVSSIFASTITSHLAYGIDTFRSKSQAEALPNLWRVVLEDNDLLISALDGLPENSLIEPIFTLCEAQGKGQELFTTVIETELQMVSQESELYRRNSPTTRLFALFLHKYASTYIRNTLQKPISALRCRSESYSMELDPSKLVTEGRTSLQTTLKRNQDNLEETASRFIDAICESASQMPPQISRLLRIVAEKTAAKFPNSVHKSVGSFLILRMLGPAIMKQTGDETLPDVRRQVLAVVKILTNLANNTLFKEAHMLAVNEFLSENILKLDKFIDDVSNTEYTAPDHMASWTDALPDYLGLSSDAAYALMKTLTDEGDRIKVLWIQRKVKKGLSVEAIRAVTRYLTLLVMELNEPFVYQNIPSISDRFPNGRNSYTPLHPNPAGLILYDNSRVDVLHIVGFSRASRPVFYVGIHELRLLTSPFKDPIAHAIESLTNSYNRNDVEVFIDLTDSGNSNQDDNLKEIFLNFLTGKVAQHSHTIYIHNITHLYWSLMRASLAQSILSESPKTIFLDHSLDLEPYFDTMICARLTAKHGQTVRTCPDILSIRDETYPGLDWPYKMTIHRNDVLCLSTVNQHELVPSKKVRLVETVRLDNIKDIQITNDHLIMSLHVGTDIKVSSNDVASVSRYLKFALLEHKTSALHYREETNKSGEIVRGLLLCLGLLNIVSRDIQMRELGAGILVNLLPEEELLEHGVFRQNTSRMVLLENQEILAIHKTARRNCTSITQTAFLQELLSRIPHIGDFEQVTTLPCFGIWLEGLSDVLGSNLSVPENYIRTILTALVDLYNPREDSRLAMLAWEVLVKQPLLHPLMLETLCSSALKFQHASLQVSRAAEIFRVIRNPFFVSKITDLLVDRLNGKYIDAVNLMQTKVWPEIEVLLRILVDLTGRATNVFINLPRILYVFGCVLKLGQSDLRQLSFQLFINAISASFCDVQLSPAGRCRLREILLHLEDSDLRVNLLLETSVVTDVSLPGTNHRSKGMVEIAIAKWMKDFAELSIQILKVSAVDKTQENVFLKDYLTLITDAAFHHTVMSRRAFLTLGVLSAELKVDLTGLLLEALIESLPKASVQECRSAVSIVMCLSQSQLANPAKLFKVSLALSLVPLPPLAAAGLHLLLRCLELLAAPGSTEVIDQCFSAYDLIWSDYQKFIGISVSSQKCLGIACILERSIRITASWELTNRITYLLIKLYSIRQPDGPQFYNILPFLVLLSAQSVNEIDLDLAFASTPMKLSLKNRGDIAAYFRKSSLDDNFGTILAALVSDLIVTTDSPLEQISLISILIAIAPLVPRIYLMIVKDLGEFLSSLLADKSHLALLRSVWELITVQKQVLANNGARELNRTNLLPTKGERLRQLGFEYLMRPHNSVNATKYEGDMKSHCAWIGKLVNSISSR